MIVETRHPDRCQRGFVAIGVAALLIVFVMLVDAATRRLQFAGDVARHRARERRLDFAIEFALAKVELDLRERFESSSAPATPTVWGRHEVESTIADGERVTIEVDVSPSGPREFVEALARIGDAPRPRPTRLPLYHLPELDAVSLRALLDVAAPPATTLTDVSLRERAIDALTDWLLRLAELGALPATPSQFEDALAPDIAAVDATLRVYLTTQLSTWCRRLDRHACLRRTHAHESRMRGKDRGHLVVLDEAAVEDPLSEIQSVGIGVLDCGYSGRFELVARVRSAEESSDRRTRERRRVVQLFDRIVLRTQADWRTANDVVGRSGTIGPVVFGPELIGDRTLELGPVRAIGGLSRDDRFELSPTLASFDDDWVVGTTVLMTRARVVHDAGRFVWQSRDREQSHVLDVPAPPAAAIVHVLTSGFIIDDRSGRLDAFDNLGQPVANEILGVASNVVELPLVDRLLVIGDGAASLLDGRLAKRTIVAPPLGPTVPGPWVTDRAAGFWALETEAVSGQERVALIHGQLRDEAIHLDRIALDEPASRAIALATPRLVALVHELPGDRLRFFRACGTVTTGLERIGAATLPFPVDRIEADRVALGLVVHRVGDANDTWVPLRHRESLRLDWGASLVLPPRVGTESAAFSAPLDASLTADRAGTRVAPFGTINSGASVLDAPDLSDLVGDGVMLTPERGETLRYTWSGPPTPGSAAVDRGSGALAIKSARLAIDAPQPARVRTLVRSVQTARLRFRPGVDWIAAHHPAGVSASEITSIVVASAPERALTMTSEIEREPRFRVWRHRRRADLAGQPWSVIVEVGDATLEPWTIDLPPFLAETAVEIDDETAPSHWRTIVWSWSEFGRAALSFAPTSSIDGQAPLHTDWLGAFELTALGSTIDIGGELVDKAFRGTVRDLALARALEVGPQVSERVGRDADRPHFRWVSPQLFDSGARLRTLVATGDFPGATTVRWRVEWIEDGRVIIAERTGSVAAAFEHVVTSPARLVVAGWLVGDGERSPLVESVRIDVLRGSDAATASVAVP